jgi:hypothetical protein
MIPRSGVRFSGQIMRQTKGTTRIRRTALAQSVKRFSDKVMHQREV